MLNRIFFFRRLCPVHLTTILSLLLMTSFLSWPAYAGPQDSQPPPRRDAEKETTNQGTPLVPPKEMPTAETPQTSRTSPTTPASTETLVGKVPPPTNPSSLSLMDNVLNRAGESFVFAGVLLVLLFLSCVSWYIIFYKWVYFRRLKRTSRVFIEAFWKTERLEALYETKSEREPSPIGELFNAGYEELTRVEKTENQEVPAGGFDRVERSMKRCRMMESSAMEHSLNFLATTGSAAPFIGLFGTVWGIMNAFASMDPNQNLLVSVVPYISEALIATALGLLAAIPAVMAYNFFVRAIRTQLVEMDNFSAEFLNLVDRHFFR